MSAPKLLIEQKQGQRILRRLNIESRGSRSYIIGSSKAAQIRLVGQGVSPIHAVVERRGNEWIIADLGSTTGTWISGESIIEKKITTTTTIRIGSHQFTIYPKGESREIFGQSGSSVNLKVKGDALELHQVVIKRGTKILETHLLPKAEAFKYYDGRSEKTFVAPATEKWIRAELGPNTLYQRLIPSQEQVGNNLFEFGGTNLKKPMAFVLSGLALLIVAAIFWPKAPQDKLALNAPVEITNPYQQMIFDAALVKKKREEAKKIMANKVVKPQESRGGNGKAGGGGDGAQAAGEPGGGGSPTGQKGAGGIQTPGASSGQGARLITNIRASGLNQLIGKIAKRSAKGVLQIGAGGNAVTPDQVASGSAIAAIAGTQTSPHASIDKVATVAGVNFGAHNNADGFRLGAVHTNGKGGCGTAYGTGVGLNTGKVGSGKGSGSGYGDGPGTGMGLDDEAEVSGGLDKEVIAEIIRRDIGQIRYCYERQLSSTPDLYGKVVVKFSINNEGAVELPKIGTSTLNNAMVEGCILRRAAKWKFPVPKGGTQVLVSYPFLFKSLK